MRSRIAELEAFQESLAGEMSHCRENKLRLELALKGGNLGVWDWDLTTGLAIWDEGTTRMLGYEPNELIPDVRTWKRSVNLDDWAKVSEALNAHLSGQTPFYEAEYRMRTKSGELKWFYSRGKVIEYDAEGKPLRIVGTTHDITQRRQAIEDLKRKTEEQELLLNTIDIQIWYLTDPMTYGLVNQSRADFIGKPREELEGKRLDDFYSHDVAAICELSNAEAFQTRCTVHTEEWIPNAAGEPRLISITKTPKLDEYGNVEYVVCAGSDITERKRTEDALRDNNERYQDLYRMIRLMCDNVPDMIWAKDLNGRFLFVNRAICEKLLIANDTTEPIGKYDMYFAERQRQANPDDPNWHTFGENCVDSDAVVMTSKKPQRFHESGNVRGQFLYLDVYKAPFLNEKGKMIGTVGCGRDVTMERKLEDSLREREKWYRSLVENSFDGLIVQKGGKVIFANSRLHEMLGYEYGELEGMDHWLIYDKDYQTITRQRAKARERGENVIPQYEVKLKRKDGSSFWAEISAKSVTVEGEPGSEAWIRDISQRNRAQAVQRRLATAVEQAAEAILITDASGKILYANPSFERITGYSVAEVIGKNPRILSSGQHDLTFYRGLWQTITKGKSWSGHFVNKKKDGSLYHEDATISPVRDSLGKIVNYVAVKKDVTSEWNLQQQLFQAQKMEAIGTLAGGIAHDFNNLLQVILGTTEIVLWGKSKDDPDRANMQAVYDAGKSGADLVKSLLAFSRQQPTELQAIDLNQEAVNVQKLLTRTIPKNIKIEPRLSDDLDKISADATQVGQMLMNLAVNARDAMPDGGEITIETANVTLDAEYCARNPGVTPGRYVSLIFSDTGSGMDPKTLENIYQPFFTTKPVGKGTGLGLATVYGIVMRHHGHIKCYSELGHGSTFKIYFPAIKKKDHRKSAEPVADIRGGKEIVLLVEDDKIVGDLAARLLLDFGYNVIPAPNGEKALEIYRENWDRISLVVLDLLMPEMDGRECLAEILKINPLARAIVVSGYSADGTVDQLIKEGAKAFVHKPYDAMDLLQIIRDVLDG